MVSAPANLDTDRDAYPYADPNQYSHSHPYADPNQYAHSHPYADAGEHPHPAIWRAWNSRQP